MTPGGPLQVAARSFAAMEQGYSVEGQLVDLPGDRLYPARVRVEGGFIREITPIPHSSGPFLIPGFVDAHVHVESSMLPPSEFARMASVHGTVATVSDPHEIANVLGETGVHYMLNNARGLDFVFCFGAPSCVPATGFETAGAELDAAAVARLLEEPQVGYLAEVMNFPGVLAADPGLMAKIRAAQAAGKPVDGHAPGLRGEQAGRYAAAGISTDHECVSLDEALDKLACGMHILIREGSAARNFEALWPLLRSHPDRVMFCSDDKHPNDLVHGHINSLVARAVAKGIPVLDALRAAFLNPLRHYRLPLGLLREGDPANLVALRDLEHFAALDTWVGGRHLASGGRPLMAHQQVSAPNRFAAQPLSADALRLPLEGPRVQVMVVDDGQIVTRRGWADVRQSGPWLEPDTERDLLVLAVINRYEPAPPALAIVQGFGLKRGALASTVAHDSHNIIAVGADRESLARAVNALVEYGGGVAAADAQGCELLPLPIAGLMSDRDGWEVARRYEQVDAMAKAMGCALEAPFMSLSFLALLVIPSLKLSDKGLFDGERFAFTPLFGQGE